MQKLGQPGIDDDDAIMTLHKSHSIKHGTDVLAGLSSCVLQLDASVDNESTSGSHFPQIVVVRGETPRLTATSRDVAGFLGVTGSTGVVIDGTDTLVVAFAKLGDDGLPLSGGVHRSYTFDKGLFLPRSIQCQHQEDAEIQTEAMFLSSNGAASPITIADNAALPTIARDNKRWTLSTVQIGGVTIGLPTSVNVTFGSTARTEGSASHVYDTHMIQDAIQPTIQIQGLNAEAFAAANVPMSGKAATHANTSIFFRKRAEDGIGFEAVDSGNHIEITAAGVLRVDSHSTSGVARGEISLTLTCAWDGTNSPIVIDTAADLPT